MTSTATTASVAVIVCAYTCDRLDDLEACIRSLHAQRRAPDEMVCVVDNNPELAVRLGELATDNDWHALTIVENDQTPGLSGARNTGVAATSSSLTVFIDDDAVADPDWLAEIIAPIVGDDDVAASGGRIEPGWPEQRPTWFPAHLDWTIGCSIPTLPPQGGPIRNMYGASAAFRRSALEAVGGFPSELGRIGANGAGCEETEVCIRIRQVMPDARVMYAPRSEVVHRVTDERATVKYVLRRCLAEGRSKALLSHRVGASDATGDERGYAVVIAGAVTRDVFGAIRNPSRLGRAAVLTLGLGAAAYGFATERIRLR